VVNIYKHAFTFWHRPGIEPGTFRSQVGLPNHYSTAPTVANPVASVCLSVCVHGQLADVRVGDFIVGVGDTDAKWSRHVDVVAMIRDAGLAVRIALVTPVDRNFVHSASTPSRDPESTTDSSPALEKQDVSRERTPDVGTPTLSRHWPGFRCRRKRERNS